MTAAVAYNRRVGRRPTKATRLHARISQDASELIASLMDRLGMDKTAVVEEGIRCLANREGVMPPATTVKESRAGYGTTPPADAPEK